ncbi:MULTISPECIES: glycogen debranching protein GlgX [unclassified Luteococcus]|uniref:glycogen debranching protein GlgX n=1 Tax=unclassified Luteococcus TaxID=2639923 RepID=UPI00313CB902
MNSETPSPVDSSILGAQLLDDGCRFALWAPRAHRVELSLVAADRSQHNVDMARNPDGVWIVHVPGISAGQRYGYRVHGDWNPDAGMRFNPAKLLLDPYARAITAGVDYSGPILDHTAESNYLPDPRDSYESVPLSVVVAPSPAPTPIKRRRPLSECVIYETHLKGFTNLHPSVPEHLRGTYSGMAYDAVIDYLVETGINTVQLLPIHHFVSEPFIVGRGLTNYWGYNTLGFFAPHAAYSSVSTLGEQVEEFKRMVSKLHEHDIEVILDVVYNHTAEGGHEGPTLSFRGLDHLGYYRLTNDLRNDYDVTGCGNSVDTSHPGVLNMVIDSMRYWVTEMGVDGFRFDLATTLIRNEQHHVDQNHEFKKRIAEDPAFEGIKMIAEPWDMGPYGYQVGNWGPGWSEWNDQYRNFMRDFWRGATQGVATLATRLCGSPDIFDREGRGLHSSVNFITAHDGFTMRDLVTYDIKHNDANGEANRDGADDNRSWNCGWEGETVDEGINDFRHRQVKNMMATLILSSGVPMITAGDELGRTQGGNNNAYCQDSPLSWVHWDTLDSWGDVSELTSTLLKARRDFAPLRATRFRTHSEVLDADGHGLGRYDLAWLDCWDGEMRDDQWHDGGRRHLGMYVSDADAAFVTLYNGAANDVLVRLPGGAWSSGYQVVATTAHRDELPESPIAPGQEFDLPGRSVTLLRCEVASQAPKPIIDEFEEPLPAEELTAPDEAAATLAKLDEQEY